MSVETVQISGRVEQRDYEFLMGQALGGATTLSERLRYALAFFRQFHEGTRGLQQALEVIDAFSGMGRRSICTAELELGVRSELVHICMDHIPAILALTASRQGMEAQPAPDEELRKLEEQLAARMVSLVEAFLRLALTNLAPCYNPSLLRDRMDGVREVAKQLHGESDTRSSHLTPK